MRISDWSSDVCSSDLRRRVRLPTYPFERKRYWVDAVPRRPEVVAASASAVAAFAAPQAVQAFPVPDVQAQPVATMDRKPRLITRLKDLFEDVARSEEHTSELQSLMRISYAVFCLKKKKTKLSQLQHNV